MRELYLLDESTSDTAWQEHARCATVDPDLMMGGDQGAVEVCTWCAVREECGAYADANGERFGVWGGILRGPSPG